MDYLQTLFKVFNASLLATFLLGMSWTRTTPTAGWLGLVFGALRAVLVLVLDGTGVLELPGQGAASLAAITAFVVDIVLSVVVSRFTAPKPAEELVGLVRPETPREQPVDPGTTRKDSPMTSSETPAPAPARRGHGGGGTMNRCRPPTTPP